jgi:hypothetical protein
LSPLLVGLLLLLLLPGLLLGLLLGLQQQPMQLWPLMQRRK